MPRDTQGNFSLPSGTLVSSGDTVLVSQHNPAMQDIAESLTNSLDRSGSGGMRAELNMGGYRITNATPGTLPNDLATVSQIGVPIGVSMDYAGDTAPSGYVLEFGQALSRTTYSALFAVLGTKYGAGDGSTTFNVPDCRGRVTGGKDDMGGSAANRLNTALAGSTLGASGGSQTHALAAGELPAHTHTGTTDSGGIHTHNTSIPVYTNNPGGNVGLDQNANLSGTVSYATDSAGAHTHTFTTGSTGTGSAHNNVQPTIVFNKIIRTGVA